MAEAAVEVVGAWLDAVNAGDVDAALELTSSDVTIAGPRGTSRGHDVLRAWLGHAGATFATHSMYARGNAVVVSQHGVWRDAATGAVKGEMNVATRFRVAGGQVAELARYEDLDEALREAGLVETDELWPGGGQLN
ncbi:MAG TPA: nuclear transport factor 2 family protein [Longimicrobium sp.]|nr:nuclear transport factor 2 family protein [Longimicrobium sp.]